MRQAAKQCNQDLISISFISMNKRLSNQSDFSYTYTQIIKQILLEIEHDENSIKDLANYCRQFYNDNTSELTIIKEFEHDYQSTAAIWWYTRECFIYQMLNRAIRTLDYNTLITMGFFIRDMHQQIQELYRTQIITYPGEPFMVYRGQGLLITDFEKLQQSKGGLISFNNFLSTYAKPESSIAFAEDALTKTNMVGILFKMSIDTFVSSTPFASIREISFIQSEEEILFPMHTIFRIGEITKIDNTISLYQVDLQLTSETDEQLCSLNERIQKK